MLCNSKIIKYLCPCVQYWVLPVNISQHLGMALTYIDYNTFHHIEHSGL